MGITNIMSKYISDQHLSVSQITLDTGIPADKLQNDTKEILTAEELLILCRYLHVRPEEMMDNDA